MSANCCKWNKNWSLSFAHPGTNYLWQRKNSSVSCCHLSFFSACLFFSHVAKRQLLLFVEDTHTQTKAVGVLIKIATQTTCARLQEQNQVNYYGINMPYYEHWCSILGAFLSYWIIQKCVAWLCCLSVKNESIMFFRSFTDGPRWFEQLHWLMATWILHTPSTSFK